MIQTTRLILLCFLLFSACSKSKKRIKKGLLNSSKKGNKNSSSSKRKSRKPKLSQIPEEKDPNFFSKRSFKRNKKTKRRKSTKNIKSEKELLNELKKGKKLLDQTHFYRFGYGHPDQKKMRENLKEVKQIFTDNPELLNFTDIDGNNFLHLTVMKSLLATDWCSFEGKQDMLTLFVGIYRNQLDAKNKKGKTALDLTKEDTSCVHCLEQHLKDLIQKQKKI